MSRALLAFVSCAVSLVVTGVGLQAETVVPSGTAPVLDGTLAEGEWSDAFAVDLSDKARLFLKHADGYFYLGIQATTMGVGSPLVVRGGEVLVLHASAALGTAVYTRNGEAWRLRQDFVWQCRSTDFSVYAQSERARFLEQNGWLGTIGYLGEPTQFEYQIAWGSEPLTFLFLFADFADTIHLLSWPIPPADASQYASVITSSPTPASVLFALEDWAVLEKGD